MKKRIKILFHIETFLSGGTEKVLMELMKNIDKSRYEVYFVVSYDLGQLEILKSQLPVGIHFIHLIESFYLNVFKIKRQKGNITSIEKVIDEIVLMPIRRNCVKQRLRNMAKEMDYIVDWDGTLGRYSSVFENKNFIKYAHMRLSVKECNDPKTNKRLLKVLENYSTIVVISDEMRQQFYQFFPSLEEKVVRIYNSFDFDFIRILGDQKPNDFIKSIQNVKYILAAGRLDESQKDFKTLLKAFAIVKRNAKTEERLVIIGKGPDRESLEALAQELGIADKVDFMGFQDNPYYWMKRCSLFVHSSKFEGLPTVLIEAMILGKPIVATNCPTGVSEILMGGQAGELVKIGDEIGLAEEIEKMLLNPDLSNSYVVKAKERLVDFEQSKVMSQFYAVFK